MIDKEVNKLIKPILDLLSDLILKLNINATVLTFCGLFSSVICFFQIINSNFYLAFVFFLINRTFDGLDGYVARKTKITDLGGFYDIIFDFITYSLIPFGFAIAIEDNQLSFTFLLSSFIGTSSTFLATAILAEKNKDNVNFNYSKSFFYSRGLAEGFETIIFISLMFLFPDFAYILAWIFGIICWLTTIVRIINTSILFKKK